MSKREMTVPRFEEIKRQLELKVPVQTIATTLKVGERTIRQIRDGMYASPDKPKEFLPPAWCDSVDWEKVLSDVLEGHPVKFVWSEVAEDKVGYKAFWEQFHKKFPSYRQAESVHREFSPGERAEVDYAGEKAKWVSVATGEIHEMEVFVAILGHSQLIFANATDDQKTPNFISSHAKMYSAFGGVPKITAPDCLKQGVTRTHLYDPDVNRSYQSMAEHYGTAIVPARPGRPKDKALVEGAVKLVMRLYRWKVRNRLPASRREVNEVLEACTKTINSKAHTRFKCSRESSWAQTEKISLAPLPEDGFEYCEWKIASVHPDSHLSVDQAFYSAPHVHRGRKLRVKLTSTRVEIFFDLTIVASHVRDRSRRGVYVTELSHLPDNARAYLEATPQNVLSQAKFVSRDLFDFIDELFKENALGHLRRAQGFIRVARACIKSLGHAHGEAAIAEAITMMNRFNRRRVQYFNECLDQISRRPRGPVAQAEVFEKQKDESKINRKPGNPMLRYAKEEPKLEIVKT